MGWPRGVLCRRRWKLHASEILGRVQQFAGLCRQHCDRGRSESCGNVCRCYCANLEHCRFVRAGIRSTRGRRDVPLWWRLSTTSVSRISCANAGRPRPLFLFPLTRNECRHDFCNDCQSNSDFGGEEMPKTTHQHQEDAINTDKSSGLRTSTCTLGRSRNFRNPRRRKSLMGNSRKVPRIRMKTETNNGTTSLPIC